MTCFGIKYIDSMSKHHEYSSFMEPNVWDRHLWEPNVRNRHLWRPEVLNANYNYLSCREDQKWLFLTSFFTKYLKWLYLTLSNYIYIYLCNYLILWHTENPSKYNDFQIMKWYTHYIMIINHTLIFIFNTWSFKKILRALEDI